MSGLDYGKLPPKLLKAMLERLEFKSKDIVIPPRVGEDCSIIKVGDDLVAVTSDPITFTSKRLTWYCVQINVNDIVMVGALPKWMVLTLLLPKYFSENMVKELFDELDIAIKKYGIELIGGHTEITPGINNPIAIATLIGTFKKPENYLDKRKIKEGDLIYLVKGIAIEGTSIIANEKEEELERYFDRDFINRVKNFLYDPGISVYREAIVFHDMDSIVAMHDPTEGGLFGGIFEMLEPLGLGAEIFYKNIFIYPETIKLCEIFKIKPEFLIASGCIIVVVKNKKEREFLKYIKGIKVPINKIGIIRGDGRFLVNYGDVIEELEEPGGDEIAKIFN